jgi:hypothetical protein
VFDALYDLHLEFKPHLKKLKSNITHKMRFDFLCDAYSIFNDD